MNISTKKSLRRRGRRNDFPGTGFNFSHQYDNTKLRRLQSPMWTEIETLCCDNCAADVLGIFEKSGKFNVLVADELPRVIRVNAPLNELEWAFESWSNLKLSEVR